MFSSIKFKGYCSALLLAGAVVVTNVSLASAADMADVQGSGAYRTGSAPMVRTSSAIGEIVSDEMAAQEVAAGNASAEDFNDPIEPFNRAMFDFNEVLQNLIFRPIAGTYNTLPATMREAIANLLHNLNTPVILANDLLQGEYDRAGNTLVRFMVNTLAGAGGVADVAAGMGIEKHTEDFGQTLGSWGVGEGFYMVLPVFGPSNPRDLVGKLVVDSYFDPLSSVYIDDEAFTWSWSGVKGVTQYAGVVEELDQIKSTSIDYYAAIRSMYRQKRSSEISNGKEVDLPPIPDFDLSFQEQLDEENGQVSSANIE